MLEFRMVAPPGDRDHPIIIPDDDVDEIIVQRQIRKQRRLVRRINLETGTDDWIRR